MLGFDVFILNNNNNQATSTQVLSGINCSMVHLGHISSTYNCRFRWETRV